MAMQTDYALAWKDLKARIDAQREVLVEIRDLLREIRDAQPPPKSKA